MEPCEHHVIHVWQCIGQVQRYAHHVATEDKPKILREATEESIWNRAKNSRHKTQLRRAILSVGLKQAAVDLLEESQTTGHSSVRYSLEDPAEDVWAYEPQRHCARIKFSHVCIHTGTSVSKFIEVFSLLSPFQLRELLVIMILEI